MVNISVSVTGEHDDGIITSLNGFVTSEVDISYDEAEYAVIGSLNECWYDIDPNSVILNKVCIGNFIFSVKTKNDNYNDIMDFITKRRWKWCLKKYFFI